MERWKDVPGYSGYYEVSNRGRVRSVCRTIRDSKGKSFRKRGVVLKLKPHQQGYYVVTLSKRNKQRDYLVHRLVASAFIGPCPIGQDVLHRNDVKRNNRRSNLYYGTRKQNGADAVRNNRTAKGERQGGSKLKEDQVLRIRKLWKMGAKSQVELAAMYGVHYMSIYGIIHRKTWTHV